MEIKGQRRRRGSDLTRHIEFMMYHRQEIKRAIAEERERQKGGHSGGGSSGHAFVSDPTALQGIKAATELISVNIDSGNVIKWPERWLRVIDKTYEQAGDLQRAVMQARYEDHEIATRTCMRLAIGKTLYYGLLDNALAFAGMAACQMGLMRII